MLQRSSVHQPCALAPTNPRCLKDPGLRDKYYEELDTIVAGIANRTVLVVAGDFNAKTGSRHKQYPENMGRYGKGHLNENGEGLLDFASHHNLVLTNTKFQHKLLHQTTWESTYRRHTTKDGEERRNPHRNQIDYILLRKRNMQQVMNSRSYPHNNTMTSDHRSVIKTVVYRNKNAPKNINFDHLRDAKIRQEYAAEVNKIIKDANKEHLNSQERWNIITNANKTVAETILGHKERSKKSNNIEVQKLSEEQKDLNNQLNIEKDPTKREEIRKARNEKLNKTTNTSKGKNTTS